MRVGVEKIHIDSYKKVVYEANKLLKSKKTLKENYKKTLLARNISVENKKKKLIKALHKLILHTFSFDIKNKRINNIKQNTTVIREIIQKIKSINHYLEESFLIELNIIKKSLIVKALKSKKPEKYLEKARGLSKGYINKIEHTVYSLMKEIVFFDEKLIDDYKKKEVRVINKEKAGLKDLEKILMTQSELLDVLEAKMPPSSKITGKLFTKPIFNRWMPLVFALLVSFEAEYQKEQLIFSKIKKNSKIKKKIENKISHIISEKEKMLKIKQKRILAMEKIGKLGDDYKQAFHEYVAAAGL